MGKVKRKILYLILATLFTGGLSAQATGTPRFAVFGNEGRTRYNYTTDDNVSIYDSFNIKNYDDTRNLTVLIKGTIENKEGWIAFDDDNVTLEPGEEKTVSFTVLIPDDVCEGIYKAMIIAHLVDYDGRSSSGGVGIGIGSGLKITFNINSGRTCATPEPLPGLSTPAPFLGYNASVHVASNDSTRLVFVDKNGNQTYEPLDGDTLVSKGLVKMYDMNSNLLETTDLSQTPGRYNVPSGSTGENTSFYFTVETNVLNNNIADTNEITNFYVDRSGTATSPGNSYQLSGISSYSSIADNIDIRSRNLDHAGSWEGHTMSIGPDDKDQIISPLHWNNLVADTDYPYADLDHDGRVDPDDKDHIISPLYWNFPN